mmetsp:Transcript_11584/g.20575  ORF Transcript_11584/g.20575 Transcript_11584/m.20575 type:complete len:211 (-) Transcript_11584:1216-1848(-)
MPTRSCPALTPHHTVCHTTPPIQIQIEILTTVHLSVHEVGAVQHSEARRHAPLVAGRTFRAHQVARLCVQEHLLASPQEGPVHPQLRERVRHRPCPRSHQHASLRGWENPLHEDKCWQTATNRQSLLQLCHQLITIQIVAATLSLGFEHKGLRVCERLGDNLSRVRGLQIIQRPEARKKRAQHCGFRPMPKKPLHHSRPCQVLLHFLRAC